MPPNKDLVSVIMPAYNSSKYIGEAINSVIDQEHQNWELIVINDGSTDDTEEKVLQFKDSRIKYFKQVNRGVAVARNLGLQEMSGDFFCFLDADDTYYKASLSSRLKVFNESDGICFVDGASRVYDNNTKETTRVYIPRFKGICTNKLLSLSEDCFFGQTWMVKVVEGVEYRFKDGQTHSEDITFFLSICELGEYSYVDDFILDYRTCHGSAMSDLKGLEKGYFTYLSEAKKLYPKRKMKFIELRVRVAKIMFLSYLSYGQIWSALRVIRRLFI